MGEGDCELGKVEILNSEYSMMNVEVKAGSS
jgi:hypothetical protein